MKILFPFLLSLLFININCTSQTKNIEEEKWKKKLSNEQYHILREKGTERAFTGKYWNNKKEGEYNCAACGQKLFISNTKFNSGTGWPCFYDVVDDKYINSMEDNRFGMKRTEIICSNCKSHL